MNRRLCLLLVLLALPSVASAQVVDATVCDVLAKPMDFDGKTVRLKEATAVARFDEFVIEGSGCSGAIWLAYPNGTKGKAGPTALLRLQFAKNISGTPEAPKRAPVTLQRDGEFSKFDSLLATPFKARGVTCLGCPRYTVTATLTGRLDAVETPGLLRNESGAMTGLSGFGNLNLYRTRLVLQSASDVTPHEIDYAATTVPGDSRRASHATAEQAGKAAAAYGEQGEHNGVIVGFDLVNEVAPDESEKGTSNSPDGVLFIASFNMSRLNKDELSAAMSHIGTHIAEIRGAKASQERSALEESAWRATFR